MPPIVSTLVHADRGWVDPCGDDTTDVVEGLKIVCSCEYIHSISPQQLDRQRKCQLFSLSNYDGEGGGEEVHTHRPPPPPLFCRIAAWVVLFTPTRNIEGRAAPVKGAVLKHFARNCHNLLDVLIWRRKYQVFAQCSSPTTMVIAAISIVPHHPPTINKMFQTKPHSFPEFLNVLAEFHLRTKICRMNFCESHNLTPWRHSGSVAIKGISRLINDNIVIGHSKIVK